MAEQADFTTETFTLLNPPKEVPPVKAGIQQGREDIEKRFFHFTTICQNAPPFKAGMNGILIIPPLVEDPALLSGDGRG